MTDDFKFGQLDQDEIESLNSFAQAHPQQVVQACIWYDLNIVMDDEMRNHLTEKCEALAKIMDHQAEIVKSEGP